MTARLTLISHTLCPYVQRAVISLAEKNIPFERIDINLADKPDWFLRLSPLGKTPVLKVGDKALFESSVILEYLEDTAPPALHPADPLERADHRAWIEFGSAVLNGIARLYNATDAGIFESQAHAMRNRFAQLEQRVVARPYFDGSDFSLVDSVYGPVFRHFRPARHHRHHRSQFESFGLAGKPGAPSLGRRGRGSDLSVGPAQVSESTRELYLGTAGGQREDLTGKG